MKSYEFSAPTLSGSINFGRGDARQNEIAMLDSSGALRTNYRYTDFGAPSVYSVGAPTGLEPTFGGMRYLDIPGTPSGPSPVAGWPQGLYLGMFRLYDPYNGVWLSQDPLGYIDGPNRSAYVGQNPIDFIDPLGLRKPAPGKEQDAQRSFQFSSQFETFDQRLNNTANRSEGMIKQDATRVVRGVAKYSIKTENTLIPGSTVHAGKIDSVTVVHPQNEVPEDYKLEPSSKASLLSQKTVHALILAMEKSDNHRIRITSMFRNPHEQARVMFENLVNTSVRRQLQQYGRYGDQVVLLAAHDRAIGLSKEQVIAHMERLIISLGPTKVSHHAVDPSRLQVVDISPSSVRNDAIFVEALRAKGFLVLTPSESDKAIHVEIPQ